MLLLRGYVSLVITNLREGIWEDIDNLYKYLLPFKNYIDKIQKDDASLYCVAECLNEIKDYYNSGNISPLFLDIKDVTLNLIEKKWTKHENVDVMNATRFFNFEKDFNISNACISFISDWGSLYFSYYNLFSCNDKSTNKNIISLQISEFIGKHNEFSSLSTIIENLKSSCLATDKKFNSMLVWSTFLPSHPQLSMIATAILSICPSEASVERSFSIQSDIHSLERNRLAADSVQAEMRIKFNSKTI